MAAVTKLNDKQLRFADNYLLEPNATKAALDAGYAPASAATKGSMLLQNSKVQAYIERGRERLSRRVEIKQEDLVTELARIVGADMSAFIKIDEHGRPYLDWRDLPKDSLKAVQSITIDETVIPAKGEGEETTLNRKTKFTLFPKMQAIDMLGRYLGNMFPKELVIKGHIVHETPQQKRERVINGMGAIIDLEPDGQLPEKTE